MECMIYLSDDCNLSCTYCYEGERKNSSKMSLKKLDEIWGYISYLNRDDCVDLSLLGGEPLLNKKVFFAILDKVKHSDFDVNISMTTNGTLIDDKVVQAFKQHNLDLSISVDGDRYTHNLNRISKNGKDLYDKILNSIYVLLENDIKFKVRMTVTCNNVQRLYSNILYFFEKGIREYDVAFNEFESWSDEKIDILNYQLNLLDEWYLNNSQIVTVNLYDHKIPPFLAHREIMYCSAGTYQHIVVNSDGVIFPCSYVSNMKEWELGDVTTGFTKRTLIDKIKKM